MAKYLSSTLKTPKYAVTKFSIGIFLKYWAKEVNFFSSCATSFSAAVFVLNNLNIEFQVKNMWE